jgi:hypothetical protein
MLEHVSGFYEPKKCTEDTLDASLKQALESLTRENINYLNSYPFDLKLEQVMSHVLSMRNTYPRHALPRMMEHCLNLDNNAGNWLIFKKILRAHEYNLMLLSLQHAREVLCDVTGRNLTCLGPHESLDSTRQALAHALESDVYQTWDECAWDEAPPYMLHWLESCLRALYTWLCVSLDAENTREQQGSRAHYWFKGPEKEKSRVALEKILHETDYFAQKDYKLSI